MGRLSRVAPRFGEKQFRAQVSAARWPARASSQTSPAPAADSSGSGNGFVHEPEFPDRQFWCYRGAVRTIPGTRRGPAHPCKASAPPRSESSCVPAGQHTTLAGQSRCKGHERQVDAHLVFLVHKHIQSFEEIPKSRAPGCLLAVSTEDVLVGEGLAALPGHINVATSQPGLPKTSRGLGSSGKNSFQAQCASHAK